MTHSAMTANQVGRLTISYCPGIRSCATFMLEDYRNSRSESALNSFQMLPVAKFVPENKLRQHNRWRIQPYYTVSDCGREDEVA